MKSLRGFPYSPSFTNYRHSRVVGLREKCHNFAGFYLETGRKRSFISPASLFSVEQTQFLYPKSPDADDNVELL